MHCYFLCPLNHKRNVMKLSLYLTVLEMFRFFSFLYKFINFLYKFNFPRCASTLFISSCCFPAQPTDTDLSQRYQYVVCYAGHFQTWDAGLRDPCTCDPSGPSGLSSSMAILILETFYIHL